MARTVRGGVEELREQVVAQLGAAALVVEDVAGGVVTVAGGEPDGSATHIAELGGARPQEGALELSEFLVIGDLEAQVERSGRPVRHRMDRTLADRRRE